MKRSNIRFQCIDKAPYKYLLYFWRSRGHIAGKPIVSYCLNLINQVGNIWILVWTYSKHPSHRKHFSAKTTTCLLRTLYTLLWYGLLHFPLNTRGWGPAKSWHERTSTQWQHIYISVPFTCTAQWYETEWDWKIIACPATHRHCRRESVAIYSRS